MFDFEVRILVGDKDFRGRATADDEDLAFVKAAAEAVERAVCHQLGLRTTGGVAVHDSLEQAATNAVCELFERDAFFCHYLTKTSFRKVIPNEEVSHYDLAALRVQLASKGMSLRFGRMDCAVDLKAVVCGLSGESAKAPFGIRLGLGCHTDLKTAIDQAFLEAVRSMIGAVDGIAFVAPSLSEFLAQTHYQASDHADLGLDVQAATPTIRLFNSSQPSVVSTELRDFHPQVSVHLLAMPQCLRDIPLVAVQATSDDLQTGYIGQLRENKVNLSRLRKFCGKDLDFSTLESSPHIFG